MKIKDFDQQELETVQLAINEHWKNQIHELQLADIEARLSDFSEDQTVCPALIWEANKCSFVIIKTGNNQYRGRFFYVTSEQYNAGSSEFHDITECMTALLKRQADVDAKKQGSNVTLN